MKFTTYDVDNDIHNDINCAVDFTGGWWYYDCHVFMITILILPYF